MSKFIKTIEYSRYIKKAK